MFSRSTPFIYIARVKRTQTTSCRSKRKTGKTGDFTLHRRRKTEEEPNISVQKLHSTAEKCNFAYAMKNLTEEQEATRCRDAINRLLRSECPFALFRYPQAQEVELILQTEGEPHVVVPDKKQLEGFIFAPFHETRECPTLLIRPDIHAKGWNDIDLASERISKHSPALEMPDHEENTDISGERLYERNFLSVMSEISQGNVEKIVLAHCQKETGEHHLWGREADVFLNALASQPNTMVSLVHTRQSGRWTGCTPELLLWHEGDAWSTMALAGTRTQEDGDWDRKNQLEQEVVTRYIRATLQSLGAEVEEGRITTMHAAALMHIRTDIRFRFNTPPHPLQVARALHPTPAVCGFPKEAALRHILRQEGESRRYFAGFLGTLSENGQAHLFVNLRCAQIDPHATCYHAGGGITALSQLPKEQQEIERKMNVLKRLNPPCQKC